MSPLLEVRNISRRFGGLQVLHDVNFEVPENRIVGLIGPNGAGKSTLFDIVSGFLAPSGGEIRYAGKGITKHTVQQRSESGLYALFSDTASLWKLDGAG